MAKKKKDTAPQKFQHDAKHIASMRKRRPSRGQRKNPGAAIVGTLTKAARHGLDEEPLLTNPVHAKPVPKDTSRDIAYRTSVLVPWKIVGKFSCMISATNVATGLALQTKDFPPRSSCKKGFPMKDLHRVFEAKGKLLFLSNWKAVR